jgi:hypothetical protein
MALTLDTTIGGETANSYCDLTYADDYFADHPNTVKRDAWAALSDEAKTLLLIQACTMIDALKMTHNDREYPSLGQRMVLGSVYPKFSEFRYPYYLIQQLQLPRNCDVNSTTGDIYIPQSAMVAQCEQAAYLSALDESSLAAQRQGIFRDSVDVDTISAATGYNGKGDAYSPIAMAMIRPLLIGTRSARIGRA